MTEASKQLRFSRARHMAAAFSLANLCFLKAWSILDSWLYWFYAEAPPTSMAFLAFLANISLLCAFFYFCLRGTLKKSRWIAWPCRAAVGFGAVVALNGLRAMMGSASVPMLLRHYPAGLIMACYTAAGLAAVWALLLWHQRIVLLLKNSLLVLFPFAVFVFLCACKSWVTFINPKEYALRRPASTPVSRRVVWMIFDEADQHLLLESSLRLPNLEEFKRSAVYASNAYSPAINTERSIPALLTGKLISESKPYAISGFKVRFGDDENFEEWARSPNVFSRAAEKQLNSALIGWFIPYCRLIHRDLTRCENFGLYDAFRANSLAEEMLLIAGQLEIPKFTFARLYLSRRMHMDWIAPGAYKKEVSRYERMLAAAKNAVRDPSLHLIFLHFPVPHPPFIFNEKEQLLTSNGDSSYNGNLMLVDRIVGEMVSEMKAQGTWENTNVLITSDHWFRYRESDKQYFPNGPNADKRIPFLLHLAGQEKGVTFTTPFNSIVSIDLVLDLLESKLQTPRQAADWILTSSKLANATYVDEI